jgi:hypothetical protein
VKKEEFRRALRDRLKQVPLETRKTWSDNDLHVWWTRASREDSYLTWERATGDVWQHVSGMCSDLLGPRAIF